MNSGDAVLGAHASRNVPLAGHIFGEEDVAGSERNLPAATSSIFPPAAERNHVLPLRSWMPVDEVIRRRAPELQPRSP